jgi:hypothetical protein
VPIVAKSIRGRSAGATRLRLDAGEPVTLRDLIRNPDDRGRPLRCVPLVVQRDGGTVMLPADDEAVRRNDRMLLCGTERGKRLLEASVKNGYVLHYLLTGVDPPRGYVFRWVAERSTR